jgi:hypothetical protein
MVQTNRWFAFWFMLPLWMILPLATIRAQSNPLTSYAAPNANAIIFQRQSGDE